MKAAIAAILAILVIQPATAGHHADGGPHHRPQQQMTIPPGHLPAPGECRIWYPGKPPGQQPPPGGCGSLRNQVPADAWLIQRPREQPERVEIVSGVREAYPDGGWPAEEEQGARSDAEIIIDVYEAITGERIETLLRR